MWQEEESAFANQCVFYTAAADIQRRWTHSHSKQPQKFSYLGIKLTKEVKGLYSENFKSLMKERKRVENRKAFCGRLVELTS